MFSQMNYVATARQRYESAGNDLQKLLEIQSTTLEELLSFPNIISELQTPISTHGFFNAQKIETLISLVFDRNTLNKYPFEDARKYAFLASELLSSKIQPIVDFFLHRENVGHVRKSGKVDELDFENDFDVGKDLLLSPVNSVKSKSTNFIETCNKQALDLLISKALNQNQIDETRAGYLAKILNFYFQKNKAEFLNYFYKQNNNYLSFQNFLQYYSIVDFLNNVVLYENVLNNDSMVFHESQPQITGDFTAQKIDLFSKIITNPNFSSSFEIASHVKTIVESFFSKCKNLAESSDFMVEMFVRVKYFDFLKKSLLNCKALNIRAEILSIVKIISSFFLFISNSKVEIVNEQIKVIFQQGTTIYEEFVSLINLLKESLDEKQAQQKWTNSFKGHSFNTGIASEVCIFETFNYLIKQKFVKVDSLFYNQSFIVLVLVRLLEKI